MKLKDGMIPPGTECPFRQECPIAVADGCRHLGKNHPSNFSCAAARVFDSVSDALETSAVEPNAVEPSAVEMFVAPSPKAMKSPEMEGLLEALSSFGRSGNVCSMCGSTSIGPYDFKDDISRKEFTLSLMCQRCQDAVFEHKEEDDGPEYEDEDA